MLFSKVLHNRQLLATEQHYNTYGHSVANFWITHQWVPSTKVVLPQEKVAGVGLWDNDISVVGPEARVDKQLLLPHDVAPERVCFVSDTVLYSFSLRVVQERPEQAGVQVVQHMDQKRFVELELNGKLRGRGNRNAEVFFLQKKICLFPLPVL